MREKGKLLKLNRSDFLFLSGENVFASMGQILTMRFKTKQTVEEIRNAVRYMISMYPRLRSVVEPTLFSYRIRILDDNSRRLAVLFNDAFRVRHNLIYGTKTYLEYKKALLNEPFSLEQGLPIKFWYLPDDSKPVLFISIHHLACDGMSYNHLMGSMLAYLNGKKPPLLPVDNPSVKPVLLKKPYYKVPLQIYESFKIYIEDLKRIKGDKIINPSIQPADYFGPVNFYQHVLSHDLKTMLSKSRELGCSLTVLILAVLATTLIRRCENNKENTAGILLPFDLRPFFDGKPPLFGNYIRTMMVRAHREGIYKPKQLLEEIKAQLNRFREQAQNKEIIFPWILEELQMLVGRKNFSRGIRAAKKRGLVPITCQYSNLGNLDGLNAHGEKAQVCEAFPTTPHGVLFFVLATIEGRVNINLTYPEAEFNHNEVESIIQSFEEELTTFLK